MSAALGAQIFLIAAIQSQGPFLLIGYSVRFIPSGLSAALISTTPLFTLVVQAVIKVCSRGNFSAAENQACSRCYNQNVTCASIALRYFSASLPTLAP